MFPSSKSRNARYSYVTFKLYLTRQNSRFSIPLSASHPPRLLAKAKNDFFFKSSHGPFKVVEVQGGPRVKRFQSFNFFNFVLFPLKCGGLSCMKSNETSKKLQFHMYIVPNQSRNCSLLVRVRPRFFDQVGHIVCI